METSLAVKGQQDIVREGYFDLSPRSLHEAIQLAELMAKSELIPANFRNKPGDILIAVQYGAEIGIKPLQAMQGICVINGRPTIWGDAALGVVLQSGLMENYKEMTFEEICSAGKAVFWAKRKGIAEPIVREFSVEDAQKAHLWNNPKKQPWCEYPYRMLQMRARAFGLRDGFADALKGMSIREEVEDIPIQEAPKVLAMPRRMSERPQIENGSQQTEEVPPSDAPPNEPAVDQNPPSMSATGPDKCGKCGSSVTFHPEGKWGPWWSCSSWHETKCDWKLSLAKWEKEQTTRLPGIEG
jgi:hypothetical protein